MATDPLQAIRDISLAYPEATEKVSRGHHTFRVQDRIFATLGVDEDGRQVLTTKAAPGEQETLLAEGDQFFLPRYLGDQGWIGLRLDGETDWRHVADLLTDSYREIAPRSLSAGVGLRPAGQSLAARAVVNVGNVIGELIEGKPPKDAQVAEDVQDDTDDGGGPKVDFDPDDPTATSIEL